MLIYKYINNQLSNIHTIQKSAKHNNGLQHDIYANLALGLKKDEMRNKFLFMQLLIKLLQIQNPHRSMNIVVQPLQNFPSHNFGIHLHFHSISIVL